MVFNHIQELINDLSVLQWQIRYNEGMNTDERQFFVNRIDKTKELLNGIKDQPNRQERYSVSEYGE